MKLKKYRTTVLMLSCFSFSLLFLLLSGCAARYQNMIPNSFEISKKYPYKVSVSVVGGRETHPLWTSQISSSAYTQALELSIEKSGLFESIIKGKGADYLLDITLLKVDQPIVGLDITINIESEWVLINASTHKPVWTNTISTSYTATLGDALVAAERLQKANEGAVRENIKEGLRQLSLLSL